MGANILNQKNENNILNIYLLGKSEDFNYDIINKEFKDNNKYNWISKFNNDNLELIKEDIINNFQTKSTCNCILIFSENNKEYNIALIFDFLRNIKNIYKPSIILAINDYNNNENQEDFNNSNINKYFEIVYYRKDNYLNIENKIKFIYNYYNNIGDTLTNFLSIINDFSENKEYKNKKIEVPKSKFKANLNILVLGRPGCGKSTFINIILNEKKAREGIGYSITKLYSQYCHNLYPITFTDTPGFEDNKDLKNMEKFLQYYNTFFRQGRNKLHLVLYLINASNERTFTGVELDLIDKIYNNYKLPIFFLCTRSRSEELSLNFKEEVKINLMQKFGVKTDLIKHIYCCHLLNEKDGIYKRFGIDRILNGINNYFSNDIKKINKIFENFEKYEIFDFPYNEENNLNILSSLENSNSSKVYFNNLLVNIIEEYKKLIFELDKSNIKDTNKDNNNEKKLKAIIETLKNHLALELNCEPSQIKETKNYPLEEIESDNFCSSIIVEYYMLNDKVIEINNEIIKKYFRKAERIKNYIEKDLLKIIEDINSYMKELINNYKFAVNSFDEINKYIK